VVTKSRGDAIKGMEVFEVTPIVLGGSPTDPKNKMVLTRDQHIQAVRYWNKVISELRAQQRRPNDKGESDLPLDLTPPPPR
jgi:hypothetical protein